jgi:hypothetical protein
MRLIGCPDKDYYESGAVDAISSCVASAEYTVQVSIALKTTLDLFS